VVEDRQHQRLQQHALAERTGDGEDRRAGEVELALRVAVDVTGELVVREPGERRLVDDGGGFQLRQLGVGEAEVRDRVEHPGRTRDDAVAPPVRQPPGENFEHAGPRVRPVGERAAQHGQLVVVGEQRSADRGRLR
jgi:hypothetical protein